MRSVTIINKSKQKGKNIQAGFCESFLCRFRGLMFQKSLPPNWGLLLVQDKDSRVDSAIHMMGMYYDLAIVWINSSGKVVDVRPAYRWRSIIVPQAPARYVLELGIEHLSEFQIGDEIIFEETAV